MAINHKAALVVYLVLMIVVIVAVDLLFFRNQFGKRLVANIAIVLLFAATYLFFLRRA